MRVGLREANQRFSSLIKAVRQGEENLDHRSRPPGRAHRARQSYKRRRPYGDETLGSNRASPRWREGQAVASIQASTNSRQAAFANHYRRPELSLMPAP